MTEEIAETIAKNVTSELIARHKSYTDKTLSVQFKCAILDNSDLSETFGEFVNG